MNDFASDVKTVVGLADLMLTVGDEEQKKERAQALNRFRECFNFDVPLEVMGDLVNERKRQDVICGEQNHNQTKWLAILMEEVGEFSKELLDGSPQRAYTELTQVAAVAIAMMGSMRRNDLKPIGEN